MHNTNATADLSACNGTPTTLGQHNDCPDRNDTDRTQPVTTPSVPFSHDLRPPFVPLEHAHATYDASLTYISDDVVLFWHPPSVFSQWTLSPFTVDLVEYNCAEQFMMASKARLFGNNTALSAIIASDDPREQKRLGRQVRHFDHEVWQFECENTCTTWRPCEIFQKRGDAPCPYSNRRPPPRRSKPSRQSVGHRPERLRPARLFPCFLVRSKSAGSGLRALPRNPSLGHHRAAL